MSDAIIYSSVSQGERVLADFTTKSGNFLNVVQRILKHLPSYDNVVTYQYGEYYFALLIKNQIVYLAMADRSISDIEVAHSFLKDISTKFQQCYGDSGQRCGPNFSKEFTVVLRSSMDYFSNSDARKHQMAQIEAEIDQAKSVMHEVVANALGRGETLDRLVEKTDDLQRHAKLYYRQANTIVHRRLFLWASDGAQFLGPAGFCRLFALSDDVRHQSDGLVELMGATGEMSDEAWQRTCAIVGADRSIGLSPPQFFQLCQTMMLNLARDLDDLHEKQERFALITELFHWATGGAQLIDAGGWNRLLRKQNVPTTVLRGTWFDRNDIDEVQLQFLRDGMDSYQQLCSQVGADPSNGLSLSQFRRSMQYECHSLQISRDCRRIYDKLCLQETEELFTWASDSSDHLDCTNFVRLLMEILLPLVEDVARKPPRDERHILFLEHLSVEGFGKIVETLEQHWRELCLEVEACPSTGINLAMFRRLLDDIDMSIPRPVMHRPLTLDRIVMEKYAYDLVMVCNSHIARPMVVKLRQRQEQELCRARQRLAFVRGTCDPCTPTHLIAGLPYDILTMVCVALRLPTYSWAVAQATEIVEGVPPQVDPLFVPDRDGLRRMKPEPTNETVDVASIPEGVPVAIRTNDCVVAGQSRTKLEPEPELEPELGSEPEPGI